MLFCKVSQTTFVLFWYIANFKLSLLPPPPPPLQFFLENVTALVLPPYTKNVVRWFPHTEKKMFTYKPLQTFVGEQKCHIIFWYICSWTPVDFGQCTKKQSFKGKSGELKMGHFTPPSIRGRIQKTLFFVIIPLFALSLWKDHPVLSKITMTQNILFHLQWPA